MFVSITEVPDGSSKTSIRIQHGGTQVHSFQVARSMGRFHGRCGARVALEVADEIVDGAPVAGAAEDEVGAAELLPHDVPLAVDDLLDAVLRHHHFSVLDSALSNTPVRNQKKRQDFFEKFPKWVLWWCWHLRRRRIRLWDDFIFDFPKKDRNNILILWLECFWPDENHMNKNNSGHLDVFLRNLWIKIIDGASHMIFLFLFIPSLPGNIRIIQPTQSKLLKQLFEKSFIITSRVRWKRSIAKFNN